MSWFCKRKNERKDYQGVVEMGKEARNKHVTGEGRQEAMAQHG